jgi:hypothetical protein
MFVRHQLSHGATVAPVFGHFFAKQQGMVLVSLCVTVQITTVEDLYARAGRTLSVSIQDNTLCSQQKQ